MTIDISYLADHPECVAELAPWLHAEWGWFTPGSTVENRLAKLREHLNRHDLPLAVVAHANGVLLGTAALRAQDMETRAELTPWLASVFVMPAARERGVGALLVARIEAEARRLWFGVLHLVTFDTERYYAKRGWRELERATYRGEPVVVMSKALAAGALGHRP
jgi:N-acetylglutamate synthase-like GNAT family acetyltransferase